MTREVFIIDGARTPFLKARTGPGPFSAADMATAAGQGCMAALEAERYLASSEFAGSAS